MLKYTCTCMYVRMYIGATRGVLGGPRHKVTYQKLKIHLYHTQVSRYRIQSDYYVIFPREGYSYNNSGYRACRAKH